LLNVTEFFRDPPAWDRLREEALPLALEGKPADEPIRVWSAGCATGEEACSIAMVLAEALGVEAYRERVKIYATDVDEEALAVARQAVHTPGSPERAGGAARALLRAPR
jgi:two-component system CheB/CheR fusion protein